MKQRRALTVGILTATSAIAMSLPSMAFAQGGAPIVYKTPDAPQAMNRVGQGTNVTPQAAADPTRPRIEFRYPDQPDRIYSEAGMRTTQDAGPIAFSSSTSAISETAARQYASVNVPMAAREPAALDPAISPGGFDARATAARIAAQAALPSHRAAAPTPTFAPAAGFDEVGLAGVYDASFAGLETANGEVFDPDRLSAAHPSLPLPSLIKVINPDTDREIVVRVNDRGPFEDGRVIDLSQRAGELLGFTNGQPTNVQLSYLGPAPVANGASLQTVSSNRVVEMPMSDMPQAASTSAPVPAAASVPAPVFQQDRAFPPADAGFSVQVGSFSNIANAQRLRASLDATLFVEVVPVRVRGSDFFRVMVGPYDSREEAEALRNDLARRGVANGMVVER